MKLVSILDPELIFFDISETDRMGIYCNILKRMSKKISLPDSPDKLAKSMIEREDSLKMRYTNGIAFPHNRHEKLKDLHIGIAVLPKPVQLNPYDDPVSIVVCSLISGSTSELYLTGLAAFSRFFLKEKDGVKELIGTKDARQFIAVLEKYSVKLKHTLCAEDILNSGVQSVYKQDKLTAALDIISANRVQSVPVINDDGTLCGMITAAKVIRHTIPDYLLQLQSMAFLSSFEPFEEMLKKESDYSCGEVMEANPKNVIPTDMPLVQLTVFMIKNAINSVVVVDSCNKPVGLLSYLELVKNVLRG